jgi:hypothetical protein
MQVELIGQSQVVVPDGYLWYSISIILAIALIAIIWRYVDKNDKRHEEHEDIFKIIIGTQSDMKQMLAVHEEKHDQHERDIAELKRRS